MKLGRVIVILTPFLTDKSGVLVVALETNTTRVEAPMLGTKRNILGSKPCVLGQIGISHIGLVQAGEEEN